MISKISLPFLLLLACTSFVVAQNTQFENLVRIDYAGALEAARRLGVGPRPDDDTDDQFGSSKGMGKAGSKKSGGKAGKAGSKKSGGKAGKAGAKKSGGKAGKAGAKKSGGMAGKAGAKKSGDMAGKAGTKLAKKSQGSDSKMSHKLSAR